ncbi:hypothetical protein ABZ249_12180 [Nocardiopsis sp. NPDC006139]|uniref:hypothetical protein n=1 Tax=Nocardiopsis sp. NPDC006139 TaxID=3154578 RepID=UPI0033B8E258
MDWESTVRSLLAGAHSGTGDGTDAGAQLVVDDPSGDEAYRAALARHCRVEEDENVLWIRPIVPGEKAPGTGETIHDLSVCRRRSLSWTGLEVHENQVIFTLATGQVARIEPAQGRELAELQSWDLFVLGLSQEEERYLDDLDADSWWG